PKRVAKLLERRLFVADGGAGRLPAPGPYRERVPVPATRRVVDAAVRGEQLRADVVGREVVGRVLRPFPAEQRACRAGDELAAEGRADPLRAVFDADASAHPGRRDGCGAHRSLLSVEVEDSVVRRAERPLCGGSAGPALAVLAAVLHEAEDAHSAVDVER